MKITKSRLVELIKEEAGKMSKSDEPEHKSLFGLPPAPRSSDLQLDEGVFGKTVKELLPDLKLLSDWVKYLIEQDKQTKRTLDNINIKLDRILSGDETTQEIPADTPKPEKKAQEKQPVPDTELYNTRQLKNAMGLTDND